MLVGSSCIFQSKRRLYLLTECSDCGTRSVVGGTDLQANSDYHPWIPTLSLLRARIAPAQPPPKGMWATTALDSVSPE
jgi:hypothetical protein